MPSLSGEAFELISLRHFVIFFGFAAQVGFLLHTLFCFLLRHRHRLFLMFPAGVTLVFMSVRDLFRIPNCPSSRLKSFPLFWSSRPHLLFSAQLDNYQYDKVDYYT